MAFDPLITDPFQFPRRAFNRPGLPRIAYRIGRYADFREAMTRALDAAPELAAWTHRHPDDPGIALMEGAALLGDILSFYQEHYANEAYLRTAAWRESVAELVRLTGYRLAPGIAGRATLAFEVRGGSPLTLRAGFPVKADLEAQDTPAEFETDSELIAHPHLGRFNLFRPRRHGLVIAGGQNRFELAMADAATDAAALEAVELKKGDRLLLLPEDNLLALFFQLFLGWKPLEQPAEEIVVVDAVERTRGRVVVTLAGQLTHGWFTQCRAFRLGRTFKHYGANAAKDFVTFDLATTPPTSTSAPTKFVRDLRAFTDLGTAGYSDIDARVFPLDLEATDLAAGAQVVITGAVSDGISASVPFAVARRITAVANAAPQWANVSSVATYLRLDDVLAPHWTDFATDRDADGIEIESDIRTLRLHETRGPALRLRPLNTPVATAFNSGVGALHYYGSAAQAQALAGRRLYLSHADGRGEELTCTNAAVDFPTPAPDVARMWPLNFDRVPAVFTPADFDEPEPAVTAFGNLVDATQGKTQRDAVLGNGDNRLRFQTFALPKAPLTYVLTAGAVPPHTPELEVWVNDRLWTRVDAFYGHGPDEQIYIVREDAEGVSHVQFGDGETGVRLPSGIRNVRAVYRAGVGAQGELEAGATPTATERPQGFDKVSLAGIVSGGAEAEDGDKARLAAPGKVQSLGRLVSITDYESETLAVPGVVTASAAWDLYGGVPAVLLRVLLAAGREAEFDAVRATLAHAQRCTGPDRTPLVVEQARLRYVFLDLTYALDASFAPETVDTAVRAVLGLAGDTTQERSGVFGLRARRLGEPEYASRIEGRVQNVAGVLWCKATALGLFDAALTDPATQALAPAPRTLVAQLACAPQELLQLAAQHLVLTVAAEAAAGVCL